MLRFKGEDGGVRWWVPTCAFYLRREAFRALMMAAINEAVVSSSPCRSRSAFDSFKKCKPLGVFMLANEAGGSPHMLVR